MRTKKIKFVEFRPGTFAYEGEKHKGFVFEGGAWHASPGMEVLSELKNLPVHEERQRSISIPPLPESVFR